MTKDEFLAAEGQSEEEFDAEFDAPHPRGDAAQFVLDEIAEKEQLSVNEQELTDHLVRSASRYGMTPDEFAQQVAQGGQVPVLVSEVVRGKALALVLERRQGHRRVRPGGRPRRAARGRAGRPAGRGGRRRPRGPRPRGPRPRGPRPRRPRPQLTAVPPERPRRTPVGASRASG